MGPNPLGPGEFALETKDGEVLRGIWMLGSDVKRLKPETVRAVRPACNVYVFGSDNPEHPSTRLFNEAWVFADGSC